jgi:hypothetical protein
VSGGVTAVPLARRFLHTDDCVSLWKFDESKKPVGWILEPCSTRNLISISIGQFPHRKSGVEIYVRHKIGHAELIALNKKLGENYDLHPKELDTQGKPLVRLIYEYRIITVTARMEDVRKGKRGARQRQVEDASELPIAGDHKGVKAMLESLQPALAARAQSAEALREIAKPKTP